MTVRHSERKVPAAEQFQQYCRELAEKMATSHAARFFDYAPVTLCVFGMLSSCVLAYVRLRWWAFGPAFSASALAVLIFSDHVTGRGVIRKHLLKWMQRWPLWEKLTWPLALILIITASVIFQFWASAALGCVFGVVFAAIAIITVGPTLRNLEAELADACRKLAYGLQQQGLNQEMIQQGLPSLMGPYWPKVFEATYDYPAYRTAAEVASAESNLTVRCPWLRDLICDALTEAANNRQGVLATCAVFWQSLLKRRNPSSAASQEPSNTREPTELIRKPNSPPSGNEAAGVPASLNRSLLPVQFEDSTPLTPSVDVKGGSVELSSARTIRIDPSELISSPGSAKLHAESPTDVHLRVEVVHRAEGGGDDDLTEMEKKRAKWLKRRIEYRQELQDAWSDETRVRKSHPKLTVWCGEKMRMTVGLVLLVCFAAYLYHSEILAVLWGQRYEVRGASLESWRLFFQHCIEEISKAPMRTPIIGISGPAIGICGLGWFLSGFLRDGWLLTPFVAVASLILLITWTFPLNIGSVTTWYIATSIAYITIQLVGALLEPIIASRIVRNQAE